MPFRSEFKMNGIDFRIDNAVASVEMEGLHVTEEDRKLLRRCIGGELSYDDAVASVITRYKIAHE